MQNEQVEIALLTGGASRRMGQDKASLNVAGEPLAHRLVRLLTESNYKVTVLGREPLPGADFLPDKDQYAGPLASLRAFFPTRPAVFVLSCDIVRFDPSVVALLSERLELGNAVIPVVDGYPQPLCGLYKASAFAALLDQPDLMRVMDWARLIQATTVDVKELAIDPDWIRGANTPEEFERLSHGL